MENSIDVKNHPMYHSFSYLLENVPTVAQKGILDSLLGLAPEVRSILLAQHVADLAKKAATRRESDKPDVSGLIGDSKQVTLEIQRYFEQPMLSYVRNLLVPLSPIADHGPARNSLAVQFSEDGKTATFSFNGEWSPKKDMKKGSKDVSTLGTNDQQPAISSPELSQPLADGEVEFE